MKKKIFAIYILYLVVCFFIGQCMIGCGDSGVNNPVNPPGMKSIRLIAPGNDTSIQGGGMVRFAWSVSDVPTRYYAMQWFDTTGQHFSNAYPLGFNTTDTLLQSPAGISRTFWWRIVALYNTGDTVKSDKWQFHTY